MPVHVAEKFCVEFARLVVDYSNLCKLSCYVKFATVNGERSDHAIFGWGGPGGRVYQKAYVEFFVSPNNLKFITSYFTKYPNLSVYQVNRNGEGLSLNTTTSTPTTRQNMNVSADDSIPKTKNVTAVTWGVFPDKEVLQPTIFDPETFLVWSKEAFELWTQAWASIYDDESESCGLIYEVFCIRIFVSVCVFAHVIGICF